MNNVNSLQLEPIEPHSGRVPLSLRRRYLELFYIECHKICTDVNEAKSIVCLSVINPEILNIFISKIVLLGTK